MKIAAMVVRWRGGDEVDRCLSSLLGHGGERLSQILLVDSGSGDGGAARLAARFPDIEVVALEENRSFAHAANTGFTKTNEDGVFLLNPDTEISDGCVETLVDALEKRPRTAGVVPLLINPDGSEQHRWQLRRLPTVGRLATGRPGAAAFSTPPVAAAESAQPAAAAWLVRREVWNKLGGFDEAFTPAWWEDVDFCARLATRLGSTDFPADEGFVVVPDARVLHSGGSSVSELTDADFLASYFKNLLRYATKHHSNRLGVIRSSLGLALLGRAALHPTRRKAYLSTARRLVNPAMPASP